MHTHVFQEDQRRRQFRILKLSMVGLEWDVFYQFGMQVFFL
jgi:hypothetical protein